MRTSLHDTERKETYKDIEECELRKEPSSDALVASSESLLGKTQRAEVTDVF